MGKFLLPLLVSLSLPTSINAGISDELYKKCLEARDYAGCVRINKKLSPKKEEKISGLGIRASLIVILLN